MHVYLIFVGLFSIWHYFYLTLANVLSYRASFHSCRWTYILKYFSHLVTLVLDPITEKHFGWPRQLTKLHLSSNVGYWSAILVFNIQVFYWILLLSIPAFSQV